MSDQAFILVVDDEADVREMFAKFLTRKGYRTETAPNALEALRILRKGGVNLVLTDLQMPEFSGLELLREVRHMDAKIPVIMMSGQADLSTAVKALREEAFDFLQKPVDSNDLLETVRAAIARTRESAPSTVKDGRGVGPVYCTRAAGNPGVSVLEFNRPLDEHSSKAFDAAIRRFVSEGEIQAKVVIVLRNVTYMNNIGMNFLLSTFDDWKGQGRRVVMTQLSDPVYKYLKILGYLDYFPNAPTVQDALDLMQKS